MYTKIKITNNSNRDIPQEAVDAITFKNIDDANAVLNSYNLKIAECERVLKENKIVEQNVVVVGV